MDRVEKLAKKSKRRQKQREITRGTDERAVKNAGKNTIGAGTATTTLLYGKEALDLYDELKGRLTLSECATLEVLGRVEFTDFQLMIIGVTCVLTFVFTLGYKIVKHWEAR